MNLLVITQKMDRNDPVLGFFHRWVEEFSKYVEKLTVVCLEEGEHSLPSNVKVLSLGKEKGKSRFKYIRRFYYYIWRERKKYDSVFVHMNQEYVILGGMLWKAMGKKIYMWRNHHAGSFLTGAASLLCRKVFCTSRFSFVARYRNCRIMPVGVDTEMFRASDSLPRRANSILILGRIAPVKKIDVFIDAVRILSKERTDWNAMIVGDPLPKDAGYLDQLKSEVRKSGLSERIEFAGAVKNFETPALYSVSDVCVNLSPSGMFDKTIFESMGCGCIVITSNLNLKGKISDALIFREGDAEDLASRLGKAISLSEEARDEIRRSLREFLEREHSLSRLARDLMAELK